MATDQTDEAQLAVGFGEYTHKETGKQSIRVEVSHKGGGGVGKCEVDFVFDYDKPQDRSQEFRGIPVKELGARYCMNPRGGNFQIKPGETRTYLLPPDFLDSVKSVVAALSPERYSLNITQDGNDQVAVPGTVFGEFVQRKFD
jgi:hypothetical protein